MSKKKVFLTHLFGTAALLTVLLWAAARVWYPGPYFFGDGGWQGFRLVAAAGLVTGPLFTAVVFKPGKSRRALTTDACIILAAQVTVLCFGAWTLFAKRTALVVFADGAFYTVVGDSASLGERNARSILHESSETPAYAIAQMPDDLSSRQALRRNALATGRPLFSRDALLRPVDATSLAHLLTYDGQFRRDLSGPADSLAAQRFATRCGVDAKDFIFVPANCRYRKAVLALERQSGRLVGWFRFTGPRA